MSKKKRKTKTKTKISSAQRDVGAAELDALSFFAEHVLQDSAQPEVVRNLAESLQKVIAQSKKAEAKSASTIETLKLNLALSMGFTPSSERGSGATDPQAPTLDSGVDEESLVREKLNRARRVMRFAGRAEAKLKQRLEELETQRAARGAEKADSSNYGCESEDAAASDGGAGGSETVFSPGVTLVHRKDGPLDPPVKTTQSDGRIMDNITRNRTDLALAVTHVTFRGTTVFDPKTGERFDYDFSLVGPPGSCFTWRACLFIVIHVIGQAAPLARVERMLNGKPFTRQNMHRIIGYVAKIGLPVYLQLARELAQADVLSGDDTHTRVVEVAKALRSGKEPWAATEESSVAAPAEQQSPEKDSASAESTEPESGNVFGATVEDLGYRFPKVKHPGRFKDQHVTTCLHGQVAGKPRIAFYRSHLGSLGNLLEQILPMRSAKKSQVTLVADLSSSNRVRDPALLAKVSVTYAGCSAHARRPFYRYARHRLEDCLEILDYFKMIAIIEDMIKADPPKKRLWLRSEYEHSEQHYWDLIKSKCEELTQIFSDQTPLGKASRYVLRNYDALTMYLKTSDLPADNNRSERLLRIERLTERNTYGSKTIEGRTRLDILRTLLTTCRYAGLDEATYLLKLMITDPSLIEKNPEHFTPSAIKDLLANNSAEREQLQKILHTENITELVKPSSNYQRKANQPL